MKKNHTEIIFVIDRSSSMAGSENEAIMVVNAFIEKQKETSSGEIKATTVLFSDEYELLWNVANIEEVRLSEKEYFVRGATSLLDSVGRAIIETEQRLNRNTDSEQPDTVIFVIISDFPENSTGEFTNKKIIEMIRHKQHECCWEFIFLGKNISAFLGGE